MSHSSPARPAVGAIAPSQRVQAILDKYSSSARGATEQLLTKSPAHAGASPARAPAAATTSQLAGALAPSLSDALNAVPYPFVKSSTTFLSSGSGSASSTPSRAGRAQGTPVKSPAVLLAEIQALRAHSSSGVGSASSNSLNATPYRGMYPLSGATSAAPVLGTSTRSSGGGSASSQPFSPLKFMLPFRTSMAAAPLEASASVASSPSAQRAVQEARQTAAAESAALWRAEQRFQAATSLNESPITSLSSLPHSYFPPSTFQSTLLRSLDAVSSSPSSSPSTSPLRLADGGVHSASPQAASSGSGNGSVLSDEGEAIVRKYRAKLLAHDLIANSSDGGSSSESVQKLLQPFSHASLALPTSPVRAPSFSTSTSPAYEPEAYSALTHTSPFTASIRGSFVPPSASSPAATSVVAPGPATAASQQPHAHPLASQAAAVAAAATRWRAALGQEQRGAVSPTFRLEEETGDEEEQALFEDASVAQGEEVEEEAQCAGDEEDELEPLRVTVTRTTPSQQRSNQVQMQGRSVSPPRTPPSTSQRRSQVASSTRKTGSAHRALERREREREWERESASDWAASAATAESVQRNLTQSFREGADEQREDDASVAVRWEAAVWGTPSSVSGAAKATLPSDAAAAAFAASMPSRVPAGVSPSFAMSPAEQAAWSAARSRNSAVEAARAREIAALAASDTPVAEMDEAEFQLSNPLPRGLTRAILDDGEGEQEEEEEQKYSSPQPVAEAQEEQLLDDEAWEEVGAAEQWAAAQQEQQQDQERKEDASHERVAAEMASEPLGVPATSALGAQLQQPQLDGTADGGDDDNELTPAQRLQLASLQQSFDNTQTRSPSMSPLLGADPSSSSSVSTARQQYDALNQELEAELASFRHFGVTRSSEDLAASDAGAASTTAAAEAAAAGRFLDVDSALAPWSTQSSQQPSPRSLLNEPHPLTSLARDRSLTALPSASSFASSERPRHALTRTDRRKDEEDWQRIRQLHPASRGSGAASPSPDPVSSSPDASPLLSPFVEQLLGVGLRPFEALPPSAAAAAASSGAGGWNESDEQQQPALIATYGLQLASPSKHSLAQPHPHPLFMQARTGSGTGASTGTNSASASAVSSPASARNKGRQLLPAEEESDSDSERSTYEDAADEAQAGDSHEQSATAVLRSYRAAAEAVVRATGIRSDDATEADDSVAAQQRQQQAQQHALEELQQQHTAQLHRTQEQLLSALGLQSSQLQQWEQLQRGEHSDDDAQLQDFQQLVETSLSLFDSAPVRFFHPAALQRVSSLLIRLLQSAGGGAWSADTLDAEVQQALRAAVQGLVAAARADYFADAGQEQRDDDHASPLTAAQRAAVEQLDLASFARSSPLSVRLALTSEVMSLLRAELSHAFISAQMNSSFGLEARLLAQAHARHARRLTEEILQELAKLQSEKAQAEQQMRVEREARLQAICDAAVPADAGSDSAPSPRAARQQQQHQSGVSPRFKAPAELAKPSSQQQTQQQARQLTSPPTSTASHLSRTSSRDADAFQVHTITDEDDFEAAFQAQERQHQLQQKPSSQRQAGEAASRVQDAADGDLPLSADVDDQGFATLQLRDEHVAVHWNEFASDEDEEEEEEEEEQEEQEQQEDAEEAEQPATSKDDNDIGEEDVNAATLRAAQAQRAQQERENDEFAHLDAPSAAVSHRSNTAGAAFGRMQGTDASDSSSSSSSEESEEEDGREQQSPHRAQRSAVGRRVNAPRPAQTGPTAVAVLAVAATAAAATPIAAVSDAAHAREFEVLRDLLEGGLSESVARLRSKAAERFALAQAEAAELQEHQVELDDLLELHSAPTVQRAVAAPAQPSRQPARSGGGAALVERLPPQSSEEMHHSEDDCEEKSKQFAEEDEDEDLTRQPRARGAAATLQQQQQRQPHSSPRRAEVSRSEEDDDFLPPRHGSHRASLAASENEFVAKRCSDDDDTTEHDEQTGRPRHQDSGFSDISGMREPVESSVDAVSLSRAARYAASTDASARAGGRDSAAPSAAQARQGLLMALRQRVDASSEAPSDSHRSSPPSLAAFTAGDATTAARSTAAAAAAAAASGGGADPLSFLRVSPSRALALQAQFEHEQRRFDTQFEPTAEPDAEALPIPPAGRDELDPANFAS